MGANHQGHCWQSLLLRHGEGKGPARGSSSSCWRQGRGINAKEPSWGTSFTAGSWWCPGPRPSLTMMATPENMTAETSCQTLCGREERTRCEHTHHLYFTKHPCCLIRYQPSSSHIPQRRQPGASHGSMGSSHTDSSSLSAQTSLGEADPRPSSPQQRREVTLPIGQRSSRVPDQELLQSHAAPVSLQHLLWEKNLRASGLIS